MSLKGKYYNNKFYFYFILNIFNKLVFVFLITTNKLLILIMIIILIKEYVNLILISNHFSNNCSLIGRIKL